MPKKVSRCFSIRTCSDFSRATDLPSSCVTVSPLVRNSLMSLIFRRYQSKLGKIGRAQSRFHSPLCIIASAESISHPIMSTEFLPPLAQCIPIGSMFAFYRIIPSMLVLVIGPANRTYSFFAGKGTEIAPSIFGGSVSINMAIVTVPKSVAVGLHRGDPPWRIRLR